MALKLSKTYLLHYLVSSVQCPVSSFFKIHDSQHSFLRDIFCSRFDSELFREEWRIHDALPCQPSRHRLQSYLRVPRLPPLVGVAEDARAIRVNNFDTMASTGVSISVKPGAVMPLLPFKVNRTTERQRFSSNMVGARLANNETVLPLVTPAQPRPTLQQQASVEGKASNVRFTPRPSFDDFQGNMLAPSHSS